MICFTAPTRLLRTLALLLCFLFVNSASAGWFGALFADDPALARMGSHEYHVSQLRNYLTTLDSTQRSQLLANRSELEQLLRSDVLRSYLLRQARLEHWHENPKLAVSLQGSRDQGLYTHYLRSLTEPPASYPDKALIAKRYQESKTQLYQPGQVHLRQIFLKVDTEHPLEQVQSEIEALKVKLEKDRQAFAELARKHSQHAASAEAGGDLGWSRTDQIIPQMLAVLDKAKVGDLLGPVRSEQGLHLIELLDAKASYQPSLSDVEGSLRSLLRSEERTRLERVLLEELVKAHPLKVEDSLLRGLFEPTPSGATGVVISRMGNVEVGDGELRAQLALLEPLEREQLLHGSEALRQLVRNYTIKRFLIAQARERGFDQSEEVQLAIARAEEDAIYLSYLKAQAEPPEQFPSTEQIKRLYESNRQRFALPQRFRLAQLYLADSEGKRKVEAAGLAHQLRAAPQRFAELARAHSDHVATAMKGGALGWVRADQLLPGMSEALAKQRVPAIIGPVRSEQGWHIVYLLEREAGRERALDEIEAQLRSLLRRQKLEQNQQSYLQGMMERYSIEIHQSELDKILKGGV